MGWKAAEKLIRHWKILRGDNVRDISVPLHSPVRSSSFLPCSREISENFLSFWRQVMIIRGKDKGESGLIKRVIRSQNRVIVEGKNLVT